MMEGNTNQFIGSKISLVSKSEIRYEGILYSLDLQEATISLAKVRSFGTENRATLRPVPPKDEIYEFIIFRGSDIKGIDVIEPPAAPGDSDSNNKEESITQDDPAILQVQQFPQGHVTHQKIASANFEQQQRGPAQNQQREQQQVPTAAPVVAIVAAAPAVVAPQEYVTEKGQYDQQHQQQQQRYRGNGAYQERNNYQARGRGGGGYVPRGGGAYPQQQQRGYNRGGGGAGGYRGGGRGGYPLRTGSKKLEFEGEFDFEKANEELQSQLLKIKISDEEKIIKEQLLELEEGGGGQGGGADGENQEASHEEETFYQKDNFFDSISCEALERQKGKSSRVDWRAERKLNAETFGISQQQQQQQQQNYGYYGNRGGYRGYNNYRGYRGGGYQQQNRGGYRGSNYRGGYNNGNSLRGSGGGGGAVGLQQNNRVVYSSRKQPTNSSGDN